MAKPTAIVVWFDDNTRFHIDPDAIQSLFINESAAAGCGHPGPHQVPGPAAPVHGPFPDHQGPPPKPERAAANATTESAAASVEGGSCYYVNGVIVCN
jgi:hypothetical protein